MLERDREVVSRPAPRGLEPGPYFDEYVAKAGMPGQNYFATGFMISRVDVSRTREISFWMATEHTSTATSSTQVSRIELNAPIAMEVIDAAKPYVDVRPFHDFRDPINHLDEWHQKTGKPVLLADAAGVDWRSKAFFKPNGGEWYAKIRFFVELYGSIIQQEVFLPRRSRRDTKEKKVTLDSINSSASR